MVPPGFFTPRQLARRGHPGRRSVEATSFYDTTQLRRALENFDRLRPHQLRRDTVQHGRRERANRQFRLFRHHPADASARPCDGERRAPPGFPAIEIEGEYYWDGVVISNTPLGWTAEPVRPRTPSPSRSTSGARSASFRATWWEVAHTPEGDPVFEPHPGQYRSIQACGSGCGRHAGWLCSQKLPEGFGAHADEVKTLSDAALSASSTYNIAST